MDRVEFGQYIAKLREKAGYSSQVELAKMAGMASSTLSRLETGEIKNVSPETLIKLAPLLNVTKEHLMMGYGYLSEEGFGKEAESLSVKDKFVTALADDDELRSLFEQMEQAGELRVILRQSAKMDTKTMRKIIKMIAAFEEEEE